MMIMDTEGYSSEGYSRYCFSRGFQERNTRETRGFTVMKNLLKANIVEGENIIRVFILLTVIF